MEEKKITCTLITPLFSFGAYQRTPDLRTTELKGAMRYLYRIACPSELKTLKKDEAELFGSASGSGQAGGHASPIRLQICGEIVPKQEYLLLHDKEKKEKMKCFLAGDFVITASFNKVVFGKESMLRHKVDLEWYVDLIKLSLILCGMGRRSRKGRGCFDIDDVQYQDKQQMLDWICRTLNKIASASSEKLDKIYEIHGQTIKPKAECPFQRPVIQEITAGKRMKREQIESILQTLDKACHDLKLRKLGESLDFNITGSPGHKFASPLLIRIVKTREGYYPLYILIKGVFGNRTIDRYRSQRKKFIQELERRTEGGKR